MRNTFRILFYAKRNDHTKESKCRLMCRVSLNGTQTTISTHLSILPGKWNQREQRAIGRNDDSQLINNRLGKIRFEIERQYFDSIGTIEVLTAHQIVSKCWREPDTERGVLQLFVKHNDLFAQSVGVSKCASTYNK